jgi:release factor glutamine methyltransferase
VVASSPDPLQDPVRGSVHDAVQDSGSPTADVETLVSRLRRAGCVFAEEEAALLAESAPPGEERERLLRRRLDGEPLEQVLGWAGFCGLRVAVAPGVFVPRQRTRLLAELATARAKAVPVPALVVDLCCGTGAVGLAVEAAVADVRLDSVDLDPAAVACARQNLPTARVHEGDLYDALPADLRGRVDVLVANAPYVPSADVALLPPEARDHEHRVALDGGPDGLDLHRRIADGAPWWLAPEGTLLIETSRDQADATAAACAAAGLRTETRRDDAVGATVVVAQRVAAW